jgi:hypothetical protein
MMPDVTDDNDPVGEESVSIIFYFCFYSALLGTRKMSLRT